MKPWIVMLAAGLVVLVVFSLVSAMFRANNEQRRRSCDATLVALHAVKDTAMAGIRPVPSLPTLATYPKGLRVSAHEQRQATIAENARRRAVAAAVTVAAYRLSTSGFCS